MNNDLGKWIAWIVTGLGLLGVGTCETGCTSGEAAHDDRVRMIQELRDAGFEGKAEITVIWGTGHIAGQAFNLTGSNGTMRAEVSIDPGKE
jgi:hypothetical protein